MKPSFLVLVISLIVASAQTSTYTWFDRMANGSPDTNFCPLNICFPPSTNQTGEPGSTQLTQTGEQLVQNGTDNTGSKISFTAWGDIGSLSLIPLSNGTSVPIFEIKGTTGNAPAGYVSQDLNLADSPVKLEVMRADKMSRVPVNNDPQVSFVFNVIGNDGEPRLLRFVTGPLFAEGWVDNAFYANVSSGSSNVIDFDQLLADQGGYAYLKNIIIAIQKQSSIDSLVFALPPLNGTET
jgi:hypothetical protein